MRITLVCAALYFISPHVIAASETPSRSPHTEALIKTPSTSAQGASTVGMSDAAPVDDITAAIGRAESYSRQQLCDAVIAAAQSHDLPISFFARLIWQESGFDTSAVSRAGAQGIAQFMPEVAAEMGLDDPFDPTQALPASARFLRDLHRQFGNPGLAAAAYNAGSRRVRDWLARRGRLPKETRSYVLNITGRAPEQWIGARQKAANFTIPLGTRCQHQQAAAIVLAPQAARWSRPTPRARITRVRAESATPADAVVYKPDVY